MNRNMFQRVETCFPIESKRLHNRILHDLDTYLSDNSQSWLLKPDGSYEQIHRNPNEAVIQAQTALLEELQT
jgi:polyphosphate kinase